jgi:23S rRNA pseudouridine955/2504/2580 synthase
MKEIVVSPNEAGQRMDKLLAKVLNQCSKSFIYKMLRKKNIKLNQKKASGSELLAVGDTVQIFFSDETFAKFSDKEAFRPVIVPPEFAVIYEDADVILLNKWAGVLSQKANDSDISMNEYLLSYLLQHGRITQETLATFTPAVCNRLDRNTTGLLLAGVSLNGSQRLSEGLKNRTIDKYYLALVKGCVRKRKHLRGYLKKDAHSNQVTVVTQAQHPLSDDNRIGTPIETAYEPLASRDDVSLLRVHLITGKTHQIRAHLASEGHPIIGDGKYGDTALNRVFYEQYRVHSQLLHAVKMQFPAEFALPQLAGHSFSAPLPEVFSRVLQQLKMESDEDGNMGF